MQLIDEGAAERRSLPVLVCPPERRIVDHARWTMHTVRLPTCSWIRNSRLSPVDHVRVISAGTGLRDFCRPPATVFPCHREFLIPNLYVHGVSFGSPNFKHVHFFLPGSRGERFPLVS